MKKPLSRLLLATLALALAAAPSLAQNMRGAAANRYFEEGAAYYRAGNYAAAKQSLTRFLSRGVQSEASEEARYLLCCCGYALQDADRVAQMRQFIRRYPSSRMRHHVSALLGSTLYYAQDYAGAAEAFASCKWDYLPSSEAAQDFRLQQGLSLLALGRNTEALQAFTELAGETDRYDEACRYYMATIYYLEGNYRPALGGFLELAANGGYAFRAACRAADIYLKTKQYGQAVARCPQGLPPAEEAAQTPPEEQPLLRAEPHRIRGEALYHTGNYTEAVEELQAYIAEVGEPAREALYALGASYLECGAPLQARETLARVTAQQGHTDDALAQSAYLKQGHAFLALQERDEAQKAFAQAAALPHDAQVAEEAEFNIALALHQEKRANYSDRAARWEAFLAAHPESPYRSRAAGYLAELYLDDFPAEEALARLRNPGIRDSSLLRAHQVVAARMGMAAVGQDPREALALLDESLQIGLDEEARTQALYWRGEANYRAGGTQEAEQDFKNYIALSGGTAGGGYAQAYYNLGYLAFNAQRYAEADSIFSLYLQAEPERALRADALCRIGDCRYQRRAFDEAVAAYRAAAEADTRKLPYALYQEAYIAGLRKDYATKIALLEQLAAQYPQEQGIMPDALYELGRAYVLTGANDRALATYEQLEARFPQGEKARLAATERSMLLAQAGRTDEAARAYKAIAERYPGTPEARQSLQELKSWAIENLKVEQYLTYVDTLRGGQYAVATDEREALLEGERVALEQAAEARRIMLADSLYEAGALEELRQMGADSAQESGAKAHYLACQLLHDRGENGEAETETATFIDQGSRYGYWLARHFLLLAEICRAEGRPAEAKGYLHGLEETYAGEDDIAGRIREALQAIE